MTHHNSFRLPFTLFRIFRPPTVRAFYVARSSVAPARLAGITLIEMLVVVAILAIVATVSIPAFDSYFEKARVRYAAEEVYGLVLQARAEGPVRDQNLSVSINSEAWCLGFAAIEHCDCTLLSGATACTLAVADEQVLQVVSGDSFPSVTITSNFPGNRTTFNRLRGSASPGGTIAVSSGDTVAEVRVGVSGRVRLCTAEGSGLRGYRSC